MSEVLYLVYKTFFQRILFSCVVRLLDSELKHKIKIQFPMPKTRAPSTLFLSENASNIISGHFGFVLEENSGREIK